MTARRALWRLLGALWWWALPLRRAEALRALRDTLPKRATEAPSLLRGAVGSVALGYLELAVGSPMPIRGLDRLAAALRPDRGVLCLGGHNGPWDLLLVRCSQQVPVTVFVKRPSSRLAAWALQRLRRGGDLELLPPRGAFAAAERALQAGRVVLLVQDQRHNPGPAVPFFGRPARTSEGYARLRSLADRLGAPTFGALAWRREDGTAEGELQALNPPQDGDLTAWTQEFYEKAARERPGDWWWLHRRWR
jgi:KDO2-lipid IV(A) lauroyltransferase